MISLLPECPTATVESGFRATNHAVDELLVGTEDYRAELNREWQRCREAIEAAVAAADFGEADAPNDTSVRHALLLLELLRRIRPEHPPTRIEREPCGGIVLSKSSERYGLEYLQEYTCYNSGAIEYMDAFAGHIVRLVDVDFEDQFRSLYSCI